MSMNAALLLVRRIHISTSEISSIRCATCIQLRQKSTLAAINRGVYRASGQAETSKFSRGRRPPEWTYQSSLERARGPNPAASRPASRHSRIRERRDSSPNPKSGAWERSHRSDGSTTFTSSLRAPRHRQKDLSDDGGGGRKQHVPSSIPFSSATSEFLYGNSVVVAALHAKRRTPYTLYLHRRAQSPSHGISPNLMRLIKRTGLKTIEVGDEWLPLMDRTSQGRPHNGIILEASPLPRLSSAALQSPSPKVGDGDPDSSEFGVLSSNATGSGFTIPYQSDGWRQPLVLMIDDVLDPGNLGAVIRSAYYLGVDALALCKQTCAPLSNVALKASAGAAEAMPLLFIDDPRSFLTKSKQNGWAVYAAVTPEETAKGSHLTSAYLDDISRGAFDDNLPNPKSLVYYTDMASKATLGGSHSPLVDRPCILLLGGEGAGLKKSLQSLADHSVSMRPAKRTIDIGVDSLNVSVAAAVLSAEFLRKPPSEPPYDSAHGSDSGDGLGF